MNNTQIENVESYIYLGQRYSTRDKNQDKEIPRRITSRWTAFAKHRNIFKGNIGTCLKRQINNSCVHPVTSYGAETWALTTQAKNKLAAAQTKRERSMLNITYRDRTSNTWVREKTYVRIRDNRWTMRSTTWKPYERKRPRGRPARRWRDELDECWKVTIWQTTVQHRQTWKQHADAFAQPRDIMAAQ